MWERGAAETTLALPTTTCQVPRRHRSGQVAAAGGADADDGGFGVAAAPAAKAVGVLDAEVEDVAVAEALVAHLDFGGARGHVKGHEEEVGAAGGYCFVDDDGGRFWLGVDGACPQGDDERDRSMTVESHGRC